MTVIVALLIVTLLGVAAIAIDVGNLFWERRALQNGADAAALAAAQDFASGNGAAAAEVAARDFADSNNSRGAWVESFTQPTSNSVRVVTRSGNIDGEVPLNSILAQFLGRETYFARATATAAWGGMGGGSTVPLAFSWCEWDRFTNGLGIDALPTANLTVFHHTSSASDENDCDGPAGQDYPGGFGWLDTNGSGTCTADVILGQVGGDTGNSPPVPASSTGCTSAFFAGLIGQTVLMPVFGDVTGTGSNATYDVLGFAALEVTGFRFGGSLTGGVVPCGNPNRCISGRFVAYYDLGQEPVEGAPDYGAYVIGLTG
ncbi:pilus assembly protein TadG-related protein [Egicoccus sp. AB-alg2]|uniref:pilus assembly protein TadG-related protein n=1 Tax=Egicoccus sp. AB-alg2 TaxID=3242693 RepID=UPI00359F0CA8